MKKVTMTMLAAALMFLPMPRTLSQQKANQSFGFNAASIKGFPTGRAFLTGGGAYDPNPEAAFVQAGGGFRCLADIEQLPPGGDQFDGDLGNTTLSNRSIR